MLKKYSQNLLVVFIFLAIFEFCFADGFAGNLLVILTNIATNIFKLVGIICLLVLLIGGIVWMTAGGDMEKTKKGKQIVVAAILGLFVILASQVIVGAIANLGN